MKRTPMPPRAVRLESRTPLRAVQPGDGQGSTLSRHAWLKPAAAGMGDVETRRPRPRSAGASVAAFSQKVRRDIRGRAGNACEACGVYLGPDGGEMQHRVARGMGGSRNPVLGSVVNGVLLCSRCHAVAESRDMEMHRLGFWLWRHEAPADFPIMLRGVKTWLTPDGRYSTLPPQDGEAA